MPKPPSYPTLFNELAKLKINDLRRWSYLVEGSKAKCTLRFYSRPRTVWMSVVICDPHPHIELTYVHGGVYFGYKVPLVSVHSNLGIGRVWYFLCPATGKRCRILYFNGSHFVHREAIKGAIYESQTWSETFRALARLIDVADGYGRPTRTHYAGKPTRRYKRWLEKLGEVEDSCRVLGYPLPPRRKGRRRSW